MPGRPLHRGANKPIKARRVKAIWGFRVSCTAKASGEMSATSPSLPLPTGLTRFRERPPDLLHPPAAPLRPDLGIGKGGR